MCSILQKCIDLELVRAAVAELPSSVPTDAGQVICFLLDPEFVFMIQQEVFQSCNQQRITFRMGAFGGKSPPLDRKQGKLLHDLELFFVVLS